VSNENERESTPDEPPGPENPDAGTGVAEPTTATAPPRTKPQRPKPRLLPPYKVLLHNDDVHSFEHVILSIVKLTTLSLEEAFQKTLEAHETGVSLLLVTHQERAELYCEQFATFQLTVTTEPAD
jgi:ATP-dependent Clp protease adaptor protein ClpS